MSKKYVDKDGLQEFATKLHAKQKTIFALRSMVGAPLVASLAADMTDTTKVYVYVGSESGYTSGNWYYYNGSAWTSGGVYNSVAVQTDASLAVSGMAADAKATGDAIADVEAGLIDLDASLSIAGRAADAAAVGQALANQSSETGLTEDIKQALLTCFAYTAWINDQGQSYYEALQAALYPPTNLSYISAVYTQSGTVYDSANLNDLKSDLVVTAHYSDSTTAIITSYALSGTLNEGTSTITVSYGGKTTTFSVTVTHSIVPSGYTAYDYVEYIGANKTEDSTYFNAVIKTKVFDNLNNLIIDFDVSPKVPVSSATNVLGGQNGTGNNYLVGFYGRNDTQRISCYSHGTALGINDIPNMVIGEVCHIRLEPGTVSPSTLNADSLSATGAWTTSNVINSAIGYCSNYIMHLSKASVKKFAAIGTLKLYDASTNNLVGEYIPCVRDVDGVIGIWDTVTETFYTANTATYATIGNSSCVWAVGNWEV